MVGAAHALFHAARARRREREAERLQAALVESRLQALSSQLNPHFMFNALNSVAEMVHVDPHAADRMLVGLGELLRSSLEQQSVTLVPLSEELALLRHYLDIEKVRLGERLALDWSVAPGVGGHPVPPLVLQPLAENAIKHALALRISPGCLTGDVRAEGESVTVAIADDGAHRPQGARHGSGLANLRARLRLCPGRLDDSVARVRAWMASRPRTHAAYAPGLPTPSAYAARLAVPDGARLRMVPVDDILMLVAQANYVELVLPGRRMLLREPLTSLLERLDPACFLRLRDGSCITTSRSYRQALRNALGIGG